jgi:hypothetical protein
MLITWDAVLIAGAILISALGIMWMWLSYARKRDDQYIKYKKDTLD